MYHTKVTLWWIIKKYKNWTTDYVSFALSDENINGQKHWTWWRENFKGQNTDHDGEKISMVKTLCLEDGEKSLNESEIIRIVL